MICNELKENNIREIVRAPFGDESGRVSYLPRYMQIEHSSYCNAECIMCNHFYLHNRGAKYLQPEIVDLLEPVFPYAEMIMLNGDGEPLLHPQIGAFARRYQKYGIIVSANTNLGLEHADPEDLRGCFDSLSLSCDGARKETFELIRRGISFDVFCRNVRRLPESMPDLDPALDVVLMKENVTELSEIVGLAAELGLRRVQFNLLGVNPEIRNEADALWDCMDLAAREIRKARQRGADLGVAVSFPSVFPEDFDPGKAQAEEERIRGIDFAGLIEARKARAEAAAAGDLSQNRLNCEISGSDYPEGAEGQEGSEGSAAGSWCAWGLERCYVDLDGNVSTCCFNVHHYMGNLLKEGSFEAVWNGENYAAFRRNMRNGILPKWCGNCSWRMNNAASMAVGKTIPIRKKVKANAGVWQEHDRL